MNTVQHEGIKSATIPAIGTKSVGVSSSRIWLDEQLSKAQRKPIAVISTLTPELAYVLLQNNQGNRPIRPKKVAEYARDMECGRWDLNGETISISVDGMLNNGQNRCTAVIKSGVSIEIVFVIGVTRDSRLTVDQGIARTTGNYLSMSGIQNSNKVAAMASLIWQYENFGELRRKQAGTKSEIRDAAIRHGEEIDMSLHAVGKFKISHSQVTFSHWLLMHQIGKSCEDKINEFFEKLTKGHNLDIGDPILYCRNRLMNIISSVDSEPNPRVELVMRAWNLWVGGKTNIRQIPLSGNMPKILTR